MFRKVASVTVIFAMVISHLSPNITFAQISLSPISTASSGFFDHISLEGIKLYPENPFLIDFILETNDINLDQEFQNHTENLVHYFLTALSLPESDVWVNLSPDEPENVMTERLAQTEMGQIMLEQDYQLKKLTAELMDPTHDVGEKFWEDVRTSLEQSGNKANPEDLNAYHRVWIVPALSEVVFHDKTALIESAELNVLHEDDYLNQTDKKSFSDQIIKQKFREIILPVIHQEVNHGSRFLSLRQIYQAMILAVWYKTNLKNSFLQRVFVDKSDLSGVKTVNSNQASILYESYIKAFEDGVFNVIREEYDPAQQEIVARNYFSGGVLSVDAATISTKVVKTQRQLPLSFINQPVELTVRLGDFDFASLGVNGTNSAATLIVKDLNQEGMIKLLQHYADNLDELRIVLGKYDNGNRKDVTIDQETKDTLQKFYDFHFHSEDLEKMKQQGFLSDFYKKSGAHVLKWRGETLGTFFSLWAPNAQEVSVIGDFNEWQKPDFLSRDQVYGNHWQGFIKGAEIGANYQFLVKGQDGVERRKRDPYAFQADYKNPKISVIADQDYKWGNQNWLEQREKNHALNAPISIYEIHLASWKKKKNENGDYVWMTYEEIADNLIPYVKEMGYTHINLMPIMEYYHDQTWGYEVGQFFAPTNRFGSLPELKKFIDRLHQNEIEVMMDWVPGYFSGDIVRKNDEEKLIVDETSGLNDIDGTQLYGHDAVYGEDKAYHWQDPRRNYFNFERWEVKSFLISSAQYWIEELGFGGLNVRSMESIVYYSRQGQGPYEINSEGIQFLKDLNRAISTNGLNALMIRREFEQDDIIPENLASELGFKFQMHLDWATDILNFFRNPKEYRFKSLFSDIWKYSISKNFVLNFNHKHILQSDELQSFWQQISGDNQTKFKLLKLLYSYLMIAPAKKMTFQGEELAPDIPWVSDNGLNVHWHLLDENREESIYTQALLRDLNQLNKQEGALHHLDTHRHGFEVNHVDEKNGVVSFIRRGLNPNEQLLIVLNVSESFLGEQEIYQIGVPGQTSAVWAEIFNTDNQKYGGENRMNDDLVTTNGEQHFNGHYNRVTLKIPPQSLMIFKSVEEQNNAANNVSEQTVYTSNDSLSEAANELYGKEGIARLETEKYKILNEGSEIVIRIIADQEGSEEWLQQKPLTMYYKTDGRDETLEFNDFYFIGNINGQAVYEQRFKAEQSFEYWFSYRDKKTGIINWLQKEGENNRIDVRRIFDKDIWFYGSEFGPIVKKGGQGSVNYQLPKSIAEFVAQNPDVYRHVRNAHPINAVFPYFKNVKGVKESDWKDVDGFELFVELEGKRVKLTAKKTQVETKYGGHIQVYALNADSDQLFIEPYGSQQFLESILMTKMLDLTKYLKKGESPGILVLSDHHTGLIPYIMRKAQKYKKSFEKTAVLFTGHQLNYQGDYYENVDHKINVIADGVLGKDALPDERYFFIEDIRKVIFKDKGVNFVQAALQTMVDLFPEGMGFNSVSKGHTFNELTQKIFEGGRKLVNELKQLKRLFGMQNGIDNEKLDPLTHKSVVYQYSLDLSKEDLIQKIQDREIRVAYQDPWNEEELSEVYIQNEIETSINLVNQEGIMAFTDEQRRKNKRHFYALHRFPAADSQDSMKLMSSNFQNWSRKMVQHVSEKTYQTFGHFKNEDSGRFLIGSMGRATNQKQLDALIQSIYTVIEQQKKEKGFFEADFYINGLIDEHNPELTARLASFAMEISSRADVDISVVFSNGMYPNANLLASVDLLVMISDDEPGGIVQNEAKRFGAIPLVTKVGGLADTVFEFKDDLKKWNGFVFTPKKRKFDGSKEDIEALGYNVEQSILKMKQAMNIFYTDKQQWRQIMENGLKEDNTWDKLAKWEYFEAFNKLFYQLNSNPNLQSPLKVILRKDWSEKIAAAMLANNLDQAEVQSKQKHGGVDFSSLSSGFEAESDLVEWEFSIENLDLFRNSFTLNPVILKFQPMVLENI